MVGSCSYNVQERNGKRKNEGLDSEDYQNKIFTKQITTKKKHTVLYNILYNYKKTSYTACTRSFILD